MWKYTCPDCWVPDKVPIFTEFGPAEWQCVWVMDEPDYVTTHRISKRTGELGKKPVNLPDRCLKCKAAYRRATRMGKRIDRIYTKASEQKAPGLRYPKLITFALPHAEYHDDNNIEDRERLVRTLNKKLAKARIILQKNGVLGGTYVLECTTKFVIADYQGNLVFQWRHHPHVHMVAISPFIHHTKLKVWCEQLMEIGLGRINYEAPKGRKTVAKYISKYLIKDKRSSRTFGVMRASPGQCPPQQIQ